MTDRPVVQKGPSARRFYELSLSRQHGKSYDASIEIRLNSVTSQSQSGARETSNQPASYTGNYEPAPP